ncbi:MAG: M55 family metallopeptidase [Candidatus Bathyarchaeia archaeon]
MRLYVLTDMEGASGVLREEQTSTGSKEYEEACLSLTKDVNAAIDGALEAGASEILVNDLHGARQGFNLVLEELHPEAKCITGGPRGCRLPRLDKGFDAAFMIGYHAMAGTQGAVLDHTMSTRVIYDVRLNCMRVGEIGIDASILGAFGIPIALVTGCLKACEEARSLLGDVETVAVKEGLSRNVAICLPPTKARSLIKQGAKKALENLTKLKPLTFNPPISLEIDYTHPNYADQQERSMLAKRLGPRTLAFYGEELLQVMRSVGWY